MTIAAASAADVEAIVELARAALAEPWPREQIGRELELAWSRVDVAHDGDAVVGFAIYWLVAGELQVLAIATRADRRRRGIARALLDRAVAAARAGGCTIATLEVRRGNTAAIALYERAGFRIVHTRARYYEHGDEDALVMRLEL